uniref:DM5 domain-containing protein n=1 Tax=Syphacia muris TaxID=451379 RepID=A0A0N5A808_9BILA
MLITVLTLISTLNICTSLDFRSKLLTANSHQSKASNENPLDYNPYSQFNYNGSSYSEPSPVANVPSTTTKQPLLNPYGAKELARLASTVLNGRHHSWTNTLENNTSFSNMLLLPLATTTTMSPLLLSLESSATTGFERLKMNPEKGTTRLIVTPSTSTVKPVYIIRENLNVLQQSTKNSRNSTTTTVLSSYSKVPEYMSRKYNSNIFLPSNRLINDVLVIPSARRFYVLIIMPIHESINYQVNLKVN